MNDDQIPDALAPFDRAIRRAIFAEPRDFQETLEDLGAGNSAPRGVLPREYGLEPVGLYEVLMNDTEVVTVWASDIDSIVKLARTADACRGLDDEVEADDRVAAWRRRARAFCTRWREELMVPCPGTTCCQGLTG